MIRSLLLVCLIVGLPAVEIGGLRFRIPDSWLALPSPSPSLHRWSCDGQAEPVDRPIDQAWLQQTVGADRLAIALLPTAAADLASAAAGLRLELIELGTAVSVADDIPLTLAGRPWIAVSHHQTFAGQIVYQCTWITLVDIAGEPRCLAVSRSRGRALSAGEQQAMQAFLAGQPMPAAD